MLRVSKLPKVDNYNRLQKELEECKHLSEEIKSECPDINILVNKLKAESCFWSKNLTIESFTAGVNVC